MSYSNPQVDDSVNVTPGSALGEFLSLALWLLLALVLFAAALFYGMRWLAPLVPMHWEVRLAEPVLAQWSGHKSQAGGQQQAWLNELAGRLRPAMDWPQGMPLQVHWSDSAIPNAFATLGGHVFINQGLVDEIDSENALAMVLAHEMAHIRQRDPIVSLGAGLALGLVVNGLVGDVGALGGSAASLTQLRFSRAQEAAADALALDALERLYGHVNGAEAFFAAMLGQEHDLLRRVPEFALTHPDLAQRLRVIGQRQAALGVAQSPRPLPAELRSVGPGPTQAD